MSSSTQNVKKRTEAKSKKGALSTGPKLERTTFCTSREMDFFSERELVTQTGHDRSEWHLVAIKELVDNALDACEEADISPTISIAADATGITVADNGPGLPEATLKGAMDFTVRSSSREAYVSPARGAQGNALKTILPMPWILDPEHGKLIITTGGTTHTITCGADPISQRAVIQHDSDNSLHGLSSGTSIRLDWSPRKTKVLDRNGSHIHGSKRCRLEVEWPFLSRADHHKEAFCRMVEGFALFNPHATISLDWFGSTTTWNATDPAWLKWKPCQPTSAHWYEQRHLERLIGAYITHDKDLGADRLVSDFVAEFDGLSGSQKRSKVL